MQTHIRILMCTYNGAPFLREQLGSFLRQDHADWSLWVSDDGSTDGTTDLLEEFARNNPEREIRLLRGPGQGAAQNYLSLLCHPDLPAGHVALSDQDDIWLDGKLSRALTVMGQADPDRPVLYAGQSVIADAELRPLAVSSDPPRQPGLRNALVQNLFAGHSATLNPAALHLVRQSGRPRNIPYHDWWLYLLLSGAGAQCLLDSEPVVVWRQHGDNSIGALRRLSGIRHRARVMWAGEYSRWMDDLLDHLAGREALLTEETRHLLTDYARARIRPGPVRVLDYARLGLRRQSLSGTALFYALAVLGRA